MKRIAININATEGYAYAVNTQAVAVISNLSYFGEETEGLVILVSCGNSKMESLADFYRKNLPTHWNVVHRILDNVKSNLPNYKKSAQLLIAKMRTIGALEAKQFNADYYWSLDSDVIPKPNSLRCMVDLLNFDRGYYEVAACPYPSQGGGPFMLGHGTPHRQILPNFYPEERVIPESVVKRKKQLQDELNKLEQKNLKKIEKSEKSYKDESFDRRRILFNKIRRWDEYIDKRCPPDGNVFTVTSKFGWKKRGWLDYAYPSLGKGSIIPSDWCGFGNTLCNSRALSLIDFHGYEGRGTEDLFIIWNRWQPNNVRIGGLPHCPSDHIIRRDGGHVHLYTFHEPLGEFEGHLRQIDKPWEEE